MLHGSDSLVELMAEANLSASELARNANVDRRSIVRLTAGKKVTETTLEKIAVGISEALGREISKEDLSSNLTASLVGRDSKPKRLEVKIPSETREKLNELSSKLRVELDGDSIRTQAQRKIVESLLSQNLRQKYIDEDVKIRVIGSDGQSIELEAVALAKEDHRFSEFINGELKRRNLTQAWLAEKSGIETTHLSRVLRGERRASNEVASKIAFSLNLRKNVLGDFGYSAVSTDSRDNESKRQSNAIANLMQVPSQNSLVRFGASAENRLKLLPPDVGDTDFDTIEVLRSELLLPNGPLEQLRKRYDANPNVPQSDLFGPLTEQYYLELNKPLRSIDFRVLFIRGSRFFSARAKASKQISQGEWPGFEPSEEEAIDAVCAAHGPLILASEVGRKLVSDAAEYDATPETIQAEQDVIQEFGEAMTNEPDFVEAEDAKVVKELVTPVEGDLHPARTRAVRLMVAGSALTSIVGGVAWLAAGGGATGILASVPLAATGMFLWEVVKDTDDFKQLRSSVSKAYDRNSKSMADTVGEGQAGLLRKMKSFVARNTDLIKRIASLRPEFSWVSRVISKDTDGTGTEFEIQSLKKIVERVLAPHLERAKRNRIQIRRSGQNTISIKSPELSNALESGLSRLMPDLFGFCGERGELSISYKLNNASLDGDSKPAMLIYLQAQSIDVNSHFPDNVDKILKGTHRDRSGAGYEVSYGLKSAHEIFLKLNAQMTVKVPWPKRLDIQLVVPV